MVLAIPAQKAGGGRNMTDMTLATHALVGANRDPSSHFVIVYSDTDFLPLVLALQNLQRRVIVITCRSSPPISAAAAPSHTPSSVYGAAHAADGWIDLYRAPISIEGDCTQQPGLVTQAEFDKLAECFSFCSDGTFAQIKRLVRISNISETCGDTTLSELSKRTNFKRRVLNTLRGETSGMKTKPAVAKLLMDGGDHNVMFEIGYALQVGYINILAHQRLQHVSAYRSRTSNDCSTEISVANKYTSKTEQVYSTAIVMVLLCHSSECGCCVCFA